MKKVEFEMLTVYYVNQDTYMVEEALCLIGEVNNREIVVVNGDNIHVTAADFDRDYFDDEEMFVIDLNDDDFVTIYKNREDAVKNAGWEIEHILKELNVSKKHNEQQK